ncbi:MAG: leucine-rich repeat domain-containing protein, partial [Bacilli bacterium]|nr:leucine-rich repeat domain-containing protein [Bacilli bacterium]
PAGVTSIGDHAFRDCSGLESIVLPAGVTHIGERAFQDCSSLKSIELPAGVTSIGDHAFRGCCGLESIVLPAGVTHIGKSAFSGCTSLKSIVLPAGVTHIGDSTFSDCTSLKSIVIPAGVTSIGYAAFWGCSGLESIVLPAGVTHIGDSTFTKCTSLKSIVIPAGVTHISKSTFSDCTSLESIVIHAGVTSIGGFAFSGCSSLKSIVLPAGLTSIGDYAFSGCTSLKSIVLPAGVTHIGNSTFSDCTSLESIVIPAGVTSIGEFAFYSCTSLKSIELPAGVTSMGEGVFESCSSLKSIALPAGLTHISKSAFYKCTSLESIVIPAGVTHIGESAFKDCVNLQSIKFGDVELKNLRGVNNVVINNGEMLINHNNGKNFTIIKRDKSVVEITDEDLVKIYDDIVKRLNYDNEENSYSKIYEKINILYNKGIKRPSYAFMKVPVNEIKKLNIKLLFKLLKATDIADNIKGSLLELIYSMGIFEENIIVRNGVNYIKDGTCFLQDISAENRRQFVLGLLVDPPRIISKKDFKVIRKKYSVLAKGAYKYNRVEGNYVLGEISNQDKYKLVNIIKDNTNLMISNDKLHQMFDGMNLNQVFDGRFYTFFKNNYREILSNDNYMSALSAIQRDFSKYCDKLGVNAEEITIRAIAELRKSEPYDDVKPGCYNLAREAKSVNGGIGVSREDFNWYQDKAHPRMMSRKKSSIPNTKVILDNGYLGEFLRLDDINNLLAGEKTLCCQRYEGGRGVGRTSMEHASFSEHGRIFLVRNKEGEILGQSWVWFNNNTLCFDNFEASSIYKNSMDPSISLKGSFTKHKDSVKRIYEMAAKAVIEEANETIIQMEKQNPDKDYESSKIKSVTLGMAHDDSNFLDKFKKVDLDKIVLPPNDLGFKPYTDAERQVLIAGEEVTEKRGVPNEPLFRDKREVKKYSGNSIDEDVIAKLKRIEDAGLKENTKTFQGVSTLQQLADACDCSKEKINIVMGEDFYYLYVADRDKIQIDDLVRGEPRFMDEANIGSIEMYQVFSDILKESKNKVIKASLRQDTSNILLLQMLKRNKIELEGPVHVRSFDDSNFSATLSPSEYRSLLENRTALKKEEENVTMYDVNFKAKC